MKHSLEINNNKDSYYIFTLSFLYFGVITYLIQNIFNTSDHIYGDNLIYFLSPDAIKNWFVAGQVANKLNNSFELLNYLNLFDNNFYMKILVLIKYFFEYKLNLYQFNNTFIPTIPVFFTNSLNAVLIYKISNTFQKKINVNNIFISYLVTLIYIFSPFCSIWYTSTIDESFVIFSILIFTYYYLEFFDSKKISKSGYFLLFIAFVIMLLSRKEYLFLIPLFGFIHFILKYIETKLFLFLIIFVSVILHFLDDLYINLSFYNFIYFFKPYPYDWLLVNDIKNFVLSFEAILNYFFLPGFIYFFFLNKSPNINTIILLLLLIIGIFLTKFEYGTALRYVYLFKIYFYLLSLISYSYIYSKFIKINFHRSIDIAFFSLFSLMNIFLFFIRDLIIYNNIFDIEKINFISQTLYFLNILSAIFLLPIFERQISISNKSNHVFLIYYVLIALGIYIITSFSISFYDPSISFNNFKYIYFNSIIFLIIPSSLIFYFNSYLIKNDKQILGSLSHLVVPITVISFLLFINNSYVDFINRLLIGTIIGVFLNLCLIFIIFTNIVSLKSLIIKFPLKINLKYIFTIYSKYFYPSIYIVILVFTNLIMLQYYNMEDLFIWILSIKIPVTISLICYSIYNNFLVISNNEKNKFNKSFVLFSLILLLILFTFIFANLISEIFFYSESINAKYKLIFANLLKINILIPLLMIISLYLLRKIKNNIVTFLLIFSFLISLIFTISLSIIYLEIINYFVIINLSLLCFLSSFLFMNKIYPNMIWPNKFTKNG